MRMPAPRSVFALVFVLCLALVAGGVALAEWMRLAACPLCILQRMLYLVLAALALVGMVGARQPGLPSGVAMLMVVPAATGAFIAGYQTWIQRFAPKTDCGKDYPWWEQFVDWAGERLPVLFRPSGLCSDPGWRFLGLSIAEWSLGIFTLLSLVLLHTCLRRR